MTNGEKRIIHRGTWWPQYVLPAAVFGAGWLLRWNPFITIGAVVAVVVIVQIVKPRGPGRWTE
jgi:hypothetical protein